MKESRTNGAQLSGATAGPESPTWEMGDDGPYLTEFGKKAMMGGTGGSTGRIWR